MGEGDAVVGNLFLLRYDTECDERSKMRGFFEKAVEVHRKHEIPATYFCRGGAIDAREQEFRAFFDAVRGDALFDIQDHSYSHIGVGYEKGKPVEVLRTDYEKSFAAHERANGTRPIGVSICGTSGADGARLEGFDATPKAKVELDMLYALGVRMVNSHLVGVDESSEFCSYARLGHVDMMGFPSAFSDTSWMYRSKEADKVQFVMDRVDERASKGMNLPLMLHDWVAWTCAPDRQLSHVVRMVDYARRKGFELRTHIDCYHDKCLWQG